MGDQNEPTPPEATTEPVTEPTATDAAAASVTETAATRPGWWDAVDAADHEELRRHPAIAGITGQMFESYRRRWEAEQKAELEAKAAEQAHQRLREIAKADPYAFSEQWLTDDDRRQLAEDVSRVEGESQKSWARRIAGALQGLPEFAGFTTDDFGRLTRAMAGKPDDEALTAFNAAVLDIVSDKRSDVKATDRFKAELAKEREAIRKEVLAEIQKQGIAPAIDKPRHARASRMVDILSPFDPKFNEAYEREVLGRI